MSQIPSKHDVKMRKSVTQYINDLHDVHSKLLVVRVDLGYRKEHSQTLELSDIKRDVKRMLDNRRNNSIFKHQVGYICKFEDTPEKGIHAHTLFLFDGQQVQKDSYRADAVGEYWTEQITEGKGVFHNCNRDKDKYQRCGIGMIKHSDVEKRQNLLDHVVPYLLKTDQSIEGIRQSGREKSITKGIVPNVKRSSGRPRTKKAE